MISKLQETLMLLYIIFNSFAKNDLLKGNSNGDDIILSWVLYYFLFLFFLNHQNVLLWLLTSLRLFPEQPRGRHLIFLFLSRACSRRRPSHSFSLSFLSASRWSLTSLLVARPRRSSGPCYGAAGTAARLLSGPSHGLQRGEKRMAGSVEAPLTRVCVGALISAERKFQLGDASKSQK